MTIFNPQPEIKPKVLATDLDGTLIPLPEEPGNRMALASLGEARRTRPFGLIFATGRHDTSVLEAMVSYDLPAPDWIVCDVGTAILQQSGGRFTPLEKYAAHLAARVGRVGRDAVEALLKGMEGLEPQSAEHQRPFKISYQSAADTVDTLVHRCNAQLQAARLPFSCMGSVDPFLKVGLIDVLPQRVSKAYALLWLARHAGFLRDEVIYSGDSGNDLAALVSGFRAVVVANASPGLAGQVEATLAARGLADRCYPARQTATSGVLEGCQHFGLIPA